VLTWLFLSVKCVLRKGRGIVEIRRATGDEGTPALAIDWPGVVQTRRNVRYGVLRWLGSKVRKRLQTVSHYWCTISLNRLVQFSLRYLANRAVWFGRSISRFASIVYRYLDIRRCNPKISLKSLLID